MENINLTLLRKNLFNKISDVIKNNDILSINTKDGNAIVISQEDYDAMQETFYLMSQRKVMDKIKRGEKEDVKKMKTYNPKEPW